jgi:hypothetical protein
MNKGLFLPLLILLLTNVVFPVSSNAQPKVAKPTSRAKPTPKPTPKPVTPPTQKSAAKPAIVYSQSPFSPSTTTVPAGYVGQDVEQIYNWFLARPKGATIAANQTIYGQVKAGSILAFPQKIEKESAYNPQTGLYNVHLLIDGMFDSKTGNDLKNRRRIKVKSDVISMTTYSTPQIKTILKSVGIEYNLLLDGWAAFPLNRGKYGYEARAQYAFPLSSTEAKAAHGNINALYIYSPLAPYTSQKQRSVVPSPEFPMHNETRYSNLHGELKQIWFYNSKTGKIYQKLIPTPPITAEAKFDQFPFTPYGTVSSSYIGHDVETLYRLFQQFPKDAYLTSYQPLYNQLTIGSVLAFSKKIEGPVLHDPTTGVVRVKMMPDIEPDQPNGLDNLNRRRVRVSSAPVVTNTYSLPEIPKVTKTIMSEYNLSLDGWDSMPLDYQSQSPYIILPLTKEQVQPAVGRMSALYIYTLKAPYFAKNVVKSAPRVESPFEGEFTYHSLRGDIKEIWIYNNRTGQVYRKLEARS